MTAFNGKYLQQCEFCGHPAHDGNLCGVGIVRCIPVMTDQEIISIGCMCKEERYD